MKHVRFLLNAMRFNRYEVYELPDDEADEYLQSGIAIEVEPEGGPTSAPKPRNRAAKKREEIVAEITENDVATEVGD
jgi:hypothetical protein